MAAAESQRGSAPEAGRQGSPCHLNSQMLEKKEV